MRYAAAELLVQSVLYITVNLYDYDILPYA